MNIDFKEYSEKLSQFMSGIITKEQWIEYCNAILEEVIDLNSDVFVRMKERGD